MDDGSGVVALGVSEPPVALSRGKIVEKLPSSEEKPPHRAVTVQTSDPVNPTKEFVGRTIWKAQLVSVVRNRP
jgi:hypothetical protein